MPASPPLSPTRKGAGLVFISGQLPRKDGLMISGDIRAQTEQVIDNLEARLASEGLGLADVIKTTVWLTEKSLAADFNAVYAARFPEPYPARSTVISGLIADADIEMEAVAVAR